MAVIADPTYVQELREKHGIPENLWPEVSRKAALTENERLLTQQKDTVAYQWATEFARIEELSRICVFCGLVSKSRRGLKAHMKKCTKVHADCAH